MGSDPTRSPSSAFRRRAPGAEIAPKGEDRSSALSSDTDSATGDEPSVGDNQFVSALARALSILNLFRPGEEPLGNGEIAERTKLSKPTVSRLTYTLARCGYLIYDSTLRTYQLGPGAMALGATALSAMNVRRMTYPLLKKLAESTDFNVGLGTRDGDMMIYTDTCEGDGLVRLRLFPGSRIPLIRTAMGHAYLAGLDVAQREALLRDFRPQFGDEWPTLLRSVKAAVRDVTLHGFCVSIGEWRKDINAVAAPIRLSVIGTYVVSLGGPAYRLSAEKFRHELGPQIAELARKVEAAILPGSGQN
jgi:DNA-binding IclR family transcriptional regulator